MPRQPVCWVLECAGCSSVLGAFVVRQNAGCFRLQPEERICVVPGSQAEFGPFPRLGAPASRSFRFRREPHDVRPCFRAQFPTSEPPCPTRCILHFVLRAGAVFRLRFGLPGAAPLVRAPAGAHRRWDPSGGFSVRAPGGAHQGAGMGGERNEECRVQSAECRMSKAVGSQPSALSRRLSAVSSQPSALSHRLSAVSSVGGLTTGGTQFGAEG